MFILWNFTKIAIPKVFRFLIHFFGFRFFIHFFFEEEPVEVEKFWKFWIQSLRKSLNSVKLGESESIFLAVDLEMFFFAVTIPKLNDNKNELINQKIVAD